MSTENAADSLSQRPERDAGLPLVGQVCPQCGGYLQAGRARCTKCSGEAREKQAPPRKAVAISGWFQFSIETLLLVTTLIAACLGACVAVPPIGIPLTAIALVAFVRTLVIGQHHRAVGLTFSAGEKFAEFLVSLVIVAGAIGVAFLVFLGIGIVCWMIAVTLFNFGPPRPPAAQLSYFLLGLAFWVAIIFGPIAAGVWFLRTARPWG